MTASTAAPRRWYVRKRLWALALLILACVFLARGYWNATRDPIVRTATVTVANWPAKTPPITILLISDTHVVGPDMTPERLRAIFKKLNASKPDLVVLAGDYISEKTMATRLYTPAEMAAPFATLRAPLGIIAVMGNHDHWADVNAITLAMQQNGVRVLDNSAARAGPLIVGGVDDAFTLHDNLKDSFAAMDTLDADAGRVAPRILVTHGPDIVPDLPSPVAAVFAGHTHCGQIVFPFIGAIRPVTRYGDRFACGDITDVAGASQRVFVSAGLGTSIIPLRYGAPPDVWLVTLKGR